VLAGALDGVTARLREGKGFGRPLAETGLYPKLATQMILVGEESGRLEEMLNRVADVYDRALKHLRDVYRSEGYLAASVGPVQLVRRRCSPSSPPNGCTPLPPAPVTDRCAVDIHSVPVDEPPLAPELTCRPDPRRGVVCSPDLEVRIPVKPGPRATINERAAATARLPEEIREMMTLLKERNDPLMRQFTGTPFGDAYEKARNIIEPGTPAKPPVPPAPAPAP
jgi:hypothetical protein